MNLLRQTIGKYGWGPILVAISVDGYRRQVINDSNNNVLEDIRKQKVAFSEAEKVALASKVKESMGKAEHQAVISRHAEAADTHMKAVEAYSAEPSVYNTEELKKAQTKVQSAWEEVKKISESDISGFFTFLYNSYTEYILTLTSDKIVCLSNIILEWFLLTSFLTILSIMLSEQIINKITWLEKFPKILYLLNLRAKVNKTLIKVHMFGHLFLLICGLISNIYMFLL